MNKIQKYALVLWMYGLFIGATVSTMGKNVTLEANLLLFALAVVSVIISFISLKEYKEMVSYLGGKK